MSFAVDGSPVGSSTIIVVDALPVNLVEEKRDECLQVYIPPMDWGQSGSGAGFLRKYGCEILWKISGSSGSGRTTWVLCERNEQMIFYAVQV